MRNLPLVSWIVILGVSLAAVQQPDMHDMSTPQQEPPAHGQQQMPGMAGMHPAEPGHEVEHAPSGTAWQPASSPAYMWMQSSGGWRFMEHGALFLTFNHQGGPRGAGKLEPMNWLMTRQQHRLGRGTLQFKQMFSAEPLTAPHPGFPELFQTGETYHGQPLVDHQHPHDVFGELSLSYQLPMTEKLAWEFYGGPAGEPALGPVTFLHRASASEIPAAPLGHHLQDSTHISYGVVTSGLRLGFVRAEGSIFNGREPDERRYNFDFAPMDSWAVRLSAQPGRNWSAQYSYGRLVQPEALEPGNINRQTASISYNRPRARGNWATTLVWGHNHKRADSTNQNSYLLESTLNFHDRNYAYTRLELLDRDELFLPVEPHPQFRIGAYTFGGVRDLVQSRVWQVALGADVTFYSKPAALDAIYGADPVSFHVFLRLRPGKMAH